MEEVISPKTNASQSIFLPNGPPISTVEKKTLWIMIIALLSILPILISSGVGLYYEDSNNSDISRDIFIAQNVLTWAAIVAIFMIGYCYSINIRLEFQRKALIKRQTDIAFEPEDMDDNNDNFSLKRKISVRPVVSPIQKEEVS